MDEIDTPNCELRLTRPEVNGTEDHPYWWYPLMKGG